MVFFQKIKYLFRGGGLLPAPPHNLEETTTVYLDQIPTEPSSTATSTRRKYKDNREGTSHTAVKTLAGEKIKIEKADASKIYKEKLRQENERIEKMKVPLDRVRKSLKSPAEKSNSAKRYRRTTRPHYPTAVRVMAIAGNEAMKVNRASRMSKL